MSEEAIGHNTKMVEAAMDDGFAWVPGKGYFATEEQIVEFARRMQGTPPARRSVLQAWTQALTLRQQGVLILALRGPDGSAKESAAKPLVRTLRSLVMNSGREGKPMAMGLHWRDDSFMSTAYITKAEDWAETCLAFFAEMDACNLHFFQHLIHAYAVVGVGHPDGLVRDRCWTFYGTACNRLHVHPEAQPEIMRRLRDGHRREDGGND